MKSSLKKMISYISIMGLACSITAKAADYAVILKTLSNPYWVEMKQGIETEAKKQHVDVDIFASASEGDYQAQLQLFEDLLNKNYKGIAFAPLSPDNLVIPVAKAYRKGIYLVNLDEKINLDNLHKAKGNIEAFITTDNEAVGAKAAQFIVDQLGKKGGEVAIIEGKAGNASGEARRRGATKVFQNNPQIKLVASQPADWDRIKALNVATNIISRNPNIKAFYAANDTMALGAVQAVINAGKNKQIIVVGTDGIPEARKMVAEGKLTATIAQNPFEIGAKGLDLLIEAQKRGTPIALNQKPKFETVNSILLTK